LSSVAERLLKLGEVNFANLSLRVVEPTRQFCRDTDSSSEDTQYSDDDDEADAAAVIVSDIPKSLSEDYLLMFLENSRRSGGGEITDMQFDQKSATAVVTFASPQGNEYFLPCEFFYLEVKSILSDVCSSQRLCVSCTVQTKDVGQ